MNAYLFSNNNKPIIQSYFKTILHGTIHNDNIEMKNIIPIEPIIVEPIKEEDVVIDISEIYGANASEDEFEYTIDNAKPTIVELYDVYTENIEEINYSNPLKEETE
jgi:hypothetical protein